jgi:hypothetical protein
VYPTAYPTEQCRHRESFPKLPSALLCSSFATRQCYHHPIASFRETSFEDHVFDCRRDNTDLSLAPPPPDELWSPLHPAHQPGQPLDLNLRIPTRPTSLTTSTSVEKTTTAKKTSTTRTLHISLINKTIRTPGKGRET